MDSRTKVISTRAWPRADAAEPQFYASPSPHERKIEITGDLEPHNVGINDSTCADARSGDNWFISSSPQKNYSASSSIKSTPEPQAPAGGISTQNWQQQQQIHNYLQRGLMEDKMRHAPSPPSYVPLPPPSAGAQVPACPEKDGNVRFGPPATASAVKHHESHLYVSSSRAPSLRSPHDPAVFGRMQDKLSKLQLGLPPKSGMPVPTLPNVENHAYPNRQHGPRQPPRPPGVSVIPLTMQRSTSEATISVAPSYWQSSSQPERQPEQLHDASAPKTMRSSSSSSAIDISKEKKRAKLLAELISTERTYHDSLMRLQTVYLRPLSRLMSSAEIDYITGGTSDIEFIFELSGNMLQKLQNRLSSYGGVLDAIPTPSMCDIVRDTIPLFKIYYRYIRNFDTASDRLKDLLTPASRKLTPAAQFLTAPETVASAGGLTFNSYLIMPIQRLPRYELLLKSLLDTTSRTHPDFDATVAAWQSIRSLNQDLNHRARLEKARMGASSHSSTSEGSNITNIGESEVNTAGTHWNPSTDRLSVFVAVPSPQQKAPSATTSAFYLRIKIKSARGLTVADNSGFLDPYVVIKTAEGNAHKTSVVKRAATTAEWNEECLIGFAAGADTRFAIVLKSNDSFMSSTELGRLEMNAAELQLGLELDLWFTIPASPKLRKKLDLTSVGELFLAMLVFD